MLFLTHTKRYWNHVHHGLVLNCDAFLFLDVTLQFLFPFIARQFDQKGVVALVLSYIFFLDVLLNLLLNEQNEVLVVDRVVVNRLAHLLV